MTDFLEIDDVLHIADRVIADFRVTDHGLLASAVARPKATVSGRDAYPGLDGKAAALLISLVRNHALLDGNKRLGWSAAVVFCQLNNRDLRPPDDDAAFELVMSIADGRLVEVVKVAGILAEWLVTLVEGVAL